MGAPNEGVARRRMPAGFAIAGALLLAGCAPAAPSPSPTPTVPADFSLLPSVDFSGLDRVSAFEGMHERVSTDYAFTDWKGIDLGRLHDDILPAVEQAEADDSAAEFYLALRAYAAAFDDGHVHVGETAAASLTATGPLAQSVIAAQSGGSVGLGLARLDDGAIVVAATTPGGAADLAGILPGAEVTRWNGLAPAEAAARVDLAALAASVPVATDEYRALEQVRLLTRMPIGESVTVQARNPDGRVVDAQLTAVDDQLAGLHLVDLAPPLSDRLEASSAPEVDTLDGGVGYIRLAWLADLADLAAYPAAIATAFDAALAGFADAPGLVVDLRGDHGGSDQLAADLCGHFTEEPAFYERTQFFDATDGDWVTLTIDGDGELVDALEVTPQQTQFDRPVAVLVDPRTISSGEGLARCIAGVADVGALVGFHGTRGSFGVANGEIPMPDGLVLHYPNGRSVDAAGGIQIDSRDGVGGVAPTERVPVTRETVDAWVAGTDVEVDAALRWLRSAG